MTARGAVVATRTRRLRTTPDTLARSGAMTVLARWRMVTPRAIGPRTTPVAGILVVTMFMLARGTVMATGTVHLRVAVPTPRILGPGKNSACRSGQHNGHDDQTLPHSTLLLQFTTHLSYAVNSDNTVRQRQQNIRLVDIDVSVLPQPFKGIGVCYNLLHAAYHTITSAPREDMGGQDDAWQRGMRTFPYVIPHAVFSDTRERVRV